jgi:two-component system nitrogen regulation sensor histidine kinase NtrY
LKLSYRVTIFVALTALAGAGATWVALRVTHGWSALALAFGLAVPVILWASHMIAGQIRILHDDLGNALRATRDGDYGLRLAVRGDREVAELKRLYNELADAVRVDRHDIHNKEVLLDTILQRTPLAVVLINAAGRVIFSNTAARDLLARGARLDGRPLADVTAHVASSLRDALMTPNDALFGVDDETFHLTQRMFRLNTQQHRLVLVERLTPELRRQEVAVWKKAIRIINHEINNTVAPISSLFHSARIAQERPEHRHRLGEIYELIEERLQFLRAFLESYAQFARLPEPRKEHTTWAAVLEPVHALYDFRIEGNAEQPASVDRTQMQQVLINLVKNAHESGSEPQDVVVSIQRTADDCVLRVLDRGRGMSDEVMRQALIPFYTTKPAGSGLGLPLCNEIVEAHGGRMRLAGRDGGGTVVTCWIPA